MDAVNRFAKLLSSLTAARPRSRKALSRERDPIVRALIERCSRLTESEEASLRNAWRMVEHDPEILARTREGERRARTARPDAVREASDAAERAYAQALHLPAKEILQLAHDPIHGPTIAAIRAYATAAAAHDVIPADLAEAMRGPWFEAIVTDDLTGLHVRSVGRSQMARLILAGESFGLLLIDIDHFKAVNGSWMHERGDRMLRRTSQAILAESPEGATAFRYGGDQFVVLVATADVREAVELGERICAAVAAIEVPESDDPDDFPGPWHLACSIGVARYPADGQTADDLLRAADTYAWEAKRAGGGRVATATAADDRCTGPRPATRRSRERD